MRIRSMWLKSGQVKALKKSFAFWASWISLTLTVLLTVCAPTALAASSVNVPIGNWAYGALDKLEGFGLVQSEVKGTRPYTRIEFARLIKEAITTKEQSAKTLPPLVNSLLEKLKWEFRDELPRFGQGEGSTASTFLKPVDEAKVQYVYASGKPHNFAVHEGTFIEGTEGTPLVYNNNGIIYGEHNNLQLQFSSTMRFKDVLSGYLEPLLLVRQNDGDWDTIGDTAQVDLLKGYAKLSPWNIEIEAGRDEMWWGQGRHGSLLLTNNAWPLDMVKLSNPTPTVLPWYFKYLGLFKYSVFVSMIQDFKVITSPPQAREIYTDVNFAGYRLQFKPLPYLELGAATTFLFGGEGRPDLTGSDIVKIIGFQGVPSLSADQVAAVDFNLQLPFLWNAEVYGEYGGEDSGTNTAAEFFFRNIGYLVGLYFPTILPDGKADFRFEFAHNAFEKDEDHRGFWYGHSLYRSGYTNEGMIMGHHMGPDAEDLFARVSYYIRDDLVTGLDYEYLARGVNAVNDPPVERSNIVGTDVTYDFNNNLSLSGRFAFGAVQNYNLKPGDEEDYLFSMGMQYQF